MKAHTTYKQLSFKEFVAEYPHLLKHFLEQAPVGATLDDFLKDDNYVVRVAGDDSSGIAEVGYPEDTWVVLK